MTKRTKQPSNKEIIDAIQFLATHMDERLAEVDENFSQIKSVMVTKGYLDNKLADLHGDSVVPAREKNRKLDALVDILHKHHVLEDYEVKILEAWGHFQE